MKTLGRLDGGEHLVALNANELRVMEALDAAVKGKFRFTRFDRSGSYGDYGDLSPALKAVSAWVDARFAVNELQDIVNEFRKELEQSDADADD